MQKDLNLLLNIKPQVATMPLSSVQLHASEDAPIATIGGHNAVIGSQARKDLIALAGFDNKSIETLKVQYGSQYTDKILRDAFKRLGNEKVSLAFDGPRITRILSPEKRATAMTPTQVVGLAEMFVSKGMSVWGLQISPDGTNANLQLTNRGETHSNPLLPGEEIQSGFEFRWDMFGGTSVNQFLERLMCTNGASITQIRNFNNLARNATPEEIYNALFGKFDQKAMAAYWNKVSELQERPLSVAEYMQVAVQLAKFKEDKAVFRAHFGEDNLSNMRWMNEYEKRSISVHDMSKGQAKNSPTPIKWWDAINAMTWLGSHPNESNVHDWDAAQLIENAGAMMQKRPDCIDWMLNPPSFN